MPSSSREDYREFMRWMAALCKVQYYARKDEREGENKPSTSEFASAYYKTTASEAARRQKRIFHHRNSGETSTQIGTMRNDLFAIDEPPSQPVNDHISCIAYICCIWRVWFQNAINSLWLILSNNVFSLPREWKE